MRNLKTLALIAAIGAALVPAVANATDAQTNMEELRELRAKDKAHDVEMLSEAGMNAVHSRLATNFSVDSEYLRLVIGSRDPSKADVLADQLCRGLSGLRKLYWTVRVYLLDGTLASQCPITIFGNQMSVPGKEE